MILVNNFLCINYAVLCNYSVPNLYIFLHIASIYCIYKYCKQYLIVCWDSRALKFLIKIIFTNENKQQCVLKRWRGKRCMSVLAYLTYFSFIQNPWKLAQETFYLKILNIYSLIKIKYEKFAFIDENEF